MLCHLIKIYTDSTVRPRYSEFFNAYSKITKCSGERIQKVADSHENDGFAGYEWTEGESPNKKLWIQKYPGTYGRGLNNINGKQGDRV